MEHEVGMKIWPCNNIQLVHKGKEKKLDKVFCGDLQKWFFQNSDYSISSLVYTSHANVIVDTKCTQIFNRKMLNSGNRLNKGRFLNDVNLDCYIQLLLALSYKLIKL